MTIDALRTRIQPSLQQDFDAVRDEFASESGTEDPRAFVRHLREWELIPIDLANSLLLEMAVEQGEPEPALRDEDDEATLLDLDSEDAEVDIVPTTLVERPPEVVVAVDPAPTVPAVPAVIPVAATVDAPSAPIADPASTEHDEGPSQEAAARTDGEASKGAEDFDPEADTVHMQRRSLPGAPPAIPSPPPSDSTGRYQVIGQHTVEDKISRFYPARDTLQDRPASWRVAHSTPQDAHARLTREMALSAALSLSGIPIVYEDRTADGYLLQPIEGSTLGERIAVARAEKAAGRAQSSSAPLRLTRCLQVACVIIAQAHARGVVHCDLAPENIILSKDEGIVFVTGWGLARVLPTSAITLSELEEQTIQSKRSPEQARGDLADTRSDVYAIGQLLQEVWTSAGTPAEGAIKRVIERACAPDPAARPKDALALSEELWGALSARDLQVREGPLLPLALAFGRYPEAVLAAAAAMWFGWSITVLLWLFG